MPVKTTDKETVSYREDDIIRKEVFQKIRDWFFTKGVYSSNFKGDISGEEALQLLSEVNDLFAFNVLSKVQDHEFAASIPKDMSEEGEEDTGTDGGITSEKAGTLSLLGKM